eukprot:28398_1
MGNRNSTFYILIAITNFAIPRAKIIVFDDMSNISKWEGKGLQNNITSHSTSHCTSPPCFTLSKARCRWGDCMIYRTVNCSYYKHIHVQFDLDATDGAYFDVKYRCGSNLEWESVLGYFDEAAEAFYDRKDVNIQFALPLECDNSPNVQILFDGSDLWRPGNLYIDNFYLCEGPCPGFCGWEWALIITGIVLGLCLAPYLVPC